VTRKFFHLAFSILFLFLTSCSMFESENPTSAEEFDQSSSLEAGNEDDDFSDLEDLEPTDDSSNMAVQDSTGSEDDTFSDIESFNENLIEDEIQKSGVAPTPEEPATQLADVSADGAGEESEFDLETSDFSAPAVESSSSTVVAANNAITNLEYKSFESGGTVVISTEQPVTYNVREEPEFNQTVIEVSGVKLPEKFKLPYIAKDFGQPVATINAYQDAGSGDARIVIQYKSNVKPNVEQKGNSILVMNGGSAGSPDASLVSNEGAAPLLVTDDMSVSSQGGGSSSSVSAISKPITLEMDEVEIREVIKLIADEVNINVIIDTNVTGNTSVHLRGVPWEQALSSILKSNSLDYVRRGNIMRVALEETLTKEASNYADRLTKEETARKTLEPKKVKVFSVNYADVNSLALQVAPLLSTSTVAGTLPGKAIGDPRTSALIVTDFEENINRVEKVVRSLDIAPLQILLEGKIVEANETFTREFGLKWTANSTFNISGKQADLRTIASSSNVTSGGLSQTLNVGTFDILGDLTAILGLFELESKVKVLSSPKVVTMNKEKAVISQTTELPLISTVVNNGTTTTSVAFNPATLSLEVTPQVTFNGDTILDVKVRRDVAGVTVTTPAGSSRGVNKRNAEAKVLVKDGQTLVLGGIYNIDEENTETGIPWLKDIPVLGYLFKSTRKNIVKNELVIFLTPKIINPEVIKNLSQLNRKVDFGGQENEDIPMAEGPSDTDNPPQAL
jgi:type IV pilus assembly protein PilQ